MSKKNTYILLAVVVVIIAGVWYVTQVQNAEAGELDGFAQCLGEKGATFYGAFWCSHCTDQKALFGKSEKLLPYVECSTPDRRGQLAACQTENITTYPTWEFADGSRESGALPLEFLAEKTSCELPTTDTETIQN